MVEADIITEMQKEMQKLISKDELDKAFDARFPKEMQVKLHNAKVAIAGLGGLGSNIAVMLARSGVGQLLLVDYDVVDVTNLNRQMYYIQHIGKPKAQVLPEIFKNIIIITHIEGLKYLRIGQVRHSLCPHVHNKFRFYRFAEPDTFRIDPCHFFPGFQPERKGNKRRNITAEAVYDAGPHFQRINLVVP